MAARLETVLISVAALRERLALLTAASRPSPPAPTAPDRALIAGAVRRLLDRAERAAQGVDPPPGRWLIRTWTGRQMDAAYPAVHAAEVRLVELYDDDEVAADIPGVIEFVRLYLDRGDQRRIEAEKLPTIAKADRRAVLQAAWAAGYAAYDLDHRQQRIFRNALIVAIGVSFLLVFLLGAIMFERPEFAPICFDSVRQEGVAVIPTPTPTPTSTPASSGSVAPRPSATGTGAATAAPTTAPPTAAGPTQTLAPPVPTGPVATPTEAPVTTSLRTNCPTGSGQDRAPDRWDVLLVVFFGMIGASLSAAVTVRNLNPSSSSYDIPLVLSILKLPLGALTAFVGVLAIRAGLVPGLSALDSPAEILVYSVVLGYAQQIATGVLDRRASSLGRS